MGKRLIGTPDTDCDEPPEALTISAADEAYLLEGYNAYFTPMLERGQVLGRFVGVRPLLRSRPGEPSSVSREYRLEWSANGLLTVAGGKYTTYRHMAEKITDAILRRLGGRARCRTRAYRLDGAPSEPWSIFVRSATAELGRQGLDAALAGHLIHRYGTHAFTVASYLQRDPASSEPLLAGEPDRRGELDYQRAEEMALRPEDHLFRRTRLGLFGLNHLPDYIS
jgi:glycerol-3-phosphate dehydrogenase